MTNTHELGEASVAELDQAIRGEVIRPGDPDYAAARRVWNGSVDRRPTLVVRPTGVADVVTAVRFATSEGLPIAVRGGGHSAAGFSTCDYGMVLDLSRMRAVRVDPGRRIAIVQGGARWGDLDHETQLHGLACTGGFVSTTGVGGFTLGGGVGHLRRKYGLACDSLVGADVVTADGTLVRAGADGDDELLWALRGGGGNFGVVSTLELALHPVGPTVFAGVVFYPSDVAADVAAGWRAALADAPDELSSTIVFTTAPPAPFLPETAHGSKVVLLVACWAGAVSDGEAAMRPLRSLATPVADLSGPLPYVALQQLIDPLWGAGAANYFTSTFLDGLPDDALELAHAYHRDAPGLPATCELHIHQAGGAISRVPGDASAFSQRDASHLVTCIARTPSSTEGFQAAVGWARAARGALARYGSGRAYVNFTGDSGLVRESYPLATYDRLAAVKARFDPMNAFRFNQNVQPQPLRSVAATG
jgi:FAD/FMN-containing dehydrogenase